MAKTEDQPKKYTWYLLRTQVQPNAGWGDLCEDCEHANSRLIDNSVLVVNTDFPCEKWGNKYPPYPNLLRYSNTGKEAKVSDVRGVDFVELCLAFAKKDGPL